VDLQDDITRLARLDACAVSDALDKLGLPGCATGFIASAPGQKIAGRVHTVALTGGPPPGADDPPPQLPENVPPPTPALAHAPVHLGAAAIERSQPGDVIVVEQRSGIEAGSWGGILSRGAKARGVAGVISDGLVRDVDEARDIGFPIFSRGYTAKTARGRIHEAATDVPVRIGDVQVHPGDYVLADSSAAVFIRPDRLADVLATAEAIAAREAAMAARLAAGEPITRVMGADYEHMLRR
jgi:4-hydroxy-4-methyl-2-oxoglutarate aldolase